MCFLKFLYSVTSPLCYTFSKKKKRKKSRLLRRVKNVNAWVSSMWQNSCSEQLPDQSCQTQREVFCQCETFRPVLELHRTVFHYVEDSLHPDSSPAYQSSPLNLWRLPNALSVWSPFICTWHHLSQRFLLYTVSVNGAQPLPLTFSNHVWSHLSGACQCDCARVGSMADQSSH